MLQPIDMYGGHNGVADVEVEPVVEEEDARPDEDIIVNQDDNQLAPELLENQVRRSTRVTRRPAYLEDYITAGSDEDD